MDIDQLISLLREGKTPEESQIKDIITLAKPIFKNEDNILDLKGPITVCGDTHGQLDDVIQLFEISGELPAVRFLFLGDYVDRGYFSIELMTLFLCLKIKYPQDMFLLRGNHETRAVNISYGFYDECLMKFNKDIYNMFNDLFDYFPMAAIINDKYFCVHGGLSPDLINLQDLREYDRFQEPDIAAFPGHLLWSDPGNVDDWKRTERRSGFFFNEQHVKDFLSENELKMIVRSHEMVDGYELIFDDTLVTIWSAPNYCYYCGNRASFMKIPEDPDGNYEFVVYDAMPFERRFPNPAQVMPSFQNP